MAPESREWTVPTPIRALLWWPATALVLVMVAPESTALSIGVAGAVLAALGTVSPIVGRGLRRVVAARDAEPAAVEPVPVGRAA